MMKRRVVHGRDVAARDMRYYILPMIGITLLSLVCMLIVK